MKNLKSKIVLITGATDGIGKRTSIKLALQNYDIIIHGRNKDKLNTLKTEILKINPKIRVEILKADFENLTEVYTSFHEIKENMKINILINNAATFNNKQKLTNDGFEITYQVNYLAHFLLTHILINKKDSHLEKIINVSSMAHANNINLNNIERKVFPVGYEAYSLSKLCNILHTFKLHRMIGNKTAVNSLHPGVINTKLLINHWGKIGTEIEEGFNMINFVLNLPKEISGKYFSNFRETLPARIAFDEDIQDKLYNISLSQLSQFLT